MRKLIFAFMLLSSPAAVADDEHEKTCKEVCKCDKNGENCKCKEVCK